MGIFFLPEPVAFTKVLHNPYLIVIIARANKKLVSSLTAHVLDRYDSEKPSAYVYDLAVLTSFQQKRIGKKLMATLNEYCSTKGFQEVFVQAETNDLQAVNFYRSTPLSNELQATHFTYLFSKINPENGEI
ncbi:AAC(3)-I family aminoglycoside 3-N-acetyltransferase [Adhaeribacter arboris]|uniref:AAC(3)-I family aminoglycoside 3-N-acetyltransferase n=1 Tax=Adhaeribacter arboris TaxID=2072846 RepID=A0A2T2YLT1_9BACT|nr:GNAT family N-acetyltransferase [Adhaeribacter arboris]PSR56468.1 AAC(3)-I family aminoglycoside 3-N-acetyltransferase [Adhaeribacter arboris]